MFKWFWTIFSLGAPGWTQIELSQNVTPFLKSTVCDNSNPSLRGEACMKSTIWEPHFPLSQNMEFIQGHPTSVFCKISVRRSRYCLEFSIIWGRLKTSRWSFHLCKIFDAYLTNSLRIFWSIIFPILLPRLGYFSYKKGNLNFRIRECDGERKRKNSHFRNTLNCALVDLKVPWVA